jgi:hypothetical protein
MLGVPSILLLLTAREGRLCLSLLSSGPELGTHALRAASGVAAVVRAVNETAALSEYKTAKAASILNCH